MLMGCFNGQQRELQTEICASVDGLCFNVQQRELQTEIILCKQFEWLGSVELLSQDGVCRLWKASMHGAPYVTVSPTVALGTVPVLVRLRRGDTVC